MKQIVIALVTIAAFGLSACASSNPRAAYVKAVQDNHAGRQQEAAQGFLQLAADAPDSREGRKARQQISSSSALVGIAVAGLLAAIAVPNFMKFKERALAGQEQREE